MPFFIALILFAHAPSSMAFSAVHYFETGTKPPHWPERLNFKKNYVRTQDAHDLLEGIWRIQFTCSGRPADLQTLIRLDLSNGETKPLFSIHLRSDGRFERIAHRKSSQSPFDPQTTVSKSGSWRSEVTAFGQVQVLCEGLSELDLSLMTIVETGENIWLDQNRNIHSWYGSGCAEGEKFMQVLTKVPQS